MEVTRRGFLKATGIGTTIALGFDVSSAEAEMRQFKIARTIETRSTCPYCAVSCGVIIHTLGDKAQERRHPPSFTSKAIPNTRSTAERFARRARLSATTSTIPTVC